MDDIWAIWPDDFMCPKEEIESNTMMENMARSDDYYLVNVTTYDMDGNPLSWIRMNK
jgi:hypothetical protein